MTSRAFRITKDNSEDLGFAVSALNFGALSIDEFKQWCLTAIERGDVSEIPDYIYDLANFSGPLFHIFDVVGFVPTWRANDEEENALLGIAAMRGGLTTDAGVSPEQALAALRRNPHVRTRFVECFPFVMLDTAT